MCSLDVVVVVCLCSSLGCNCKCLLSLARSPRRSNIISKFEEKLDHSFVIAKLRRRISLSLLQVSSLVGHSNRRQQPFANRQQAHFSVVCLFCNSFAIISHRRRQRARRVRPLAATIYHRSAAPVVVWVSASACQALDRNERVTHWHFSLLMDSRPIGRLLACLLLGAKPISSSRKCAEPDQEASLKLVG